MRVMEVREAYAREDFEYHNLEKLIVKDMQVRVGKADTASQQQASPAIHSNNTVWHVTAPAQSMSGSHDTLL